MQDSSAACLSCGSSAGEARQAWRRAVERARKPAIDAVEISGLTKAFGPVRALDGFDLAVAGGEVHGFLGSNGAGKSTTLRILLGLVRANSGHVRVLGLDPRRDTVELHGRLAYVPGDVNLWANLTGGEIIDLLAALRGSINPDRRRRLVERFELDPTKKGRTYSKGNRQKVALIAALASDVELLLLDEPTSGLDPVMEEVFRKCIEENRAAGQTVLLSSHSLSEVEALCDRVTIIRNGRRVLSGTLTELRHLTRPKLIAFLTKTSDGLAGLPGAHNLSVTGKRVEMEVDPEHLGALLQCLAQLGVRSLESRPQTLEELILRHYSQP